MFVPGNIKIKEIREYRCTLMNAMYCKLVSKNLPINVKGEKNLATSCKPRGLVVTIAAFHPGDPGLNWNCLGERQLY